MHVLHIVNNARRGGAGFVILPLIEKLTGKGVKFTVAYLLGPEQLTADYQRLGADTVHLGQNPFRIILKLFKLILNPENPVTLIHTHLVQASLIGRLVGRVAGIPVMTTRHYEKRSKSWHPLYVLEDLTSRYSQSLIAISDAVKDHLINSGYSSSSKCQRIYSPIEMSLFDVYIEQSLENQHNIVFNGRFIKLKGIRYLLEAFERVATELSGARLLLMGRYEDDSPILKQIAEHPFRDRIAIKGFVPREEVISELNLARMYIQPSLQEGLGLAALEAMGMRVPCILSDAGGLRELAGGGEQAITVPAGDSAKLAEAMITLWHDTGRAKEMGKKAYDFVQNNFNSHECTEQYYQQYLKLEAGEQI